MYVAVTILQMTEDKFWGMTPRKFFALAEEHIKANTPESERKKQNATPMTMTELMALKNR